MVSYIEQFKAIFPMILSQMTFLLPYLPTIQAVGIIFALIICLFGYRVRKLCAAFIGLLIGAAGAAAAAFYFTNNITVTIGAAIIGGGIIAFIAYCIYRLGIFLLCTALSLFFFRNLWIGQPPAITAMCIVIAVMIGFIVAFFKKIGIILVTSIGGAFAAITLFSMRNGYPTGSVSTISFIVLALVGLLIQYEPWKDRKQRKAEETQRVKKEKEQRKSSHGILPFSKNRKNKKKTKYIHDKKNAGKAKVIYRDRNTDTNTQNYDNGTESEDYLEEELDNEGYIENYNDETASTTESSYHSDPYSYNNTTSGESFSQDDFNYAKKTVYTHPTDTAYHTKINLTSNQPDTSTKNFREQMPNASANAVSKEEQLKTSYTKRDSTYESKQSLNSTNSNLSNSSDEYDFFSVINECIGTEED